MKLKIGILAAALAMASEIALAGEPASAGDDFGTLNPQELTIDYWVARSKEARFDPGMCLVRLSARQNGLRMRRPAASSTRCSEHGNYRLHALDGLDRGEWL